MSLAFRQAQNWYNGLKERELQEIAARQYCKQICGEGCSDLPDYKCSIGNPKDNKENPTFKDGDFTVNIFHNDMMGMMNKEKVPEINQALYKKISDFANKNDMKIRKTFDVNLMEHTYALEKKIHSKSLKDKIKNILSKNPAMITVSKEYNEFDAATPELFEIFGKEVLDLKTGAEKGT